MNRENKNKAALALLVLQAVAITIIAFSGRDTSSAVSAEVFRPADLRQVDQIVLKSARGTVRLQYLDGRWRVNNDYAADPQAIRLLFATLQQAVPKRKAPPSMQDSLYNMLTEDGVHVSLLEQDDTIRSFYAGGNARRAETFFALQPGEVYQVNIPGYRVYVSGILEQASSYFREKYVFPFNWGNFKDLEVTMQGESYTVGSGKNFFVVKQLAATDTAKLNTFLDNLSLLQVEEFLDAKPDSLAGDRIASYNIRDVADRRYALDLFLHNGKFVGIIDSVQWARFTAPQIEEILRSKRFFAAE